MGTVPDHPHTAGRGGGFADSRNPVAGTVRQPVRPGPADLRGVLVPRRARPPPACRLHEGAGGPGREHARHHASAAAGAGGEGRAALGRGRRPRTRRGAAAPGADREPAHRPGREARRPCPVEHVDRARAPARDHDLRRMPGSLSRGLGARLARGGGIFRRGAAGRGAGPLGRVGRRGAQVAP